LFFSEKNTPKLIVLTPILTILILTISITYFFIDSQYRYFAKQSEILEQDYIKKQKELLVFEVNRVINYIDYHLKNFKNLPKSELQKKLTSYIDTIRYGDNGYIWIHDTNYYLISHLIEKIV